MKIGILTLHRSINDGAVLQAYCLQKLLQTRLPQARVELIDYRPWNLEKIEYRKLFTRRFPFVNHYKWSKRSSLQEFINQHCSLSTTSCTTNNLQKVQKFILNQHYDAIVVGSDVVWQIRENRAYLPIPNIFWLTGLPGIKKISFAASADKSEKSLWQQEYIKKQLLDSLKDFHWISVRDEATEQILLNLGLAETQLSYMPDPTILWDFSSLLDTPKNITPSSKGKLAGIAVGSNQMSKTLTQIMVAKGYQVVNLLGSKLNGQLSLPLNYSLNQRLGIYPLLDFMVTDRFHGSIFTLKLSNAPLIFIEESDKYRDYPSKGRDLFQRLGIEAMVLRSEGGEVPDNLIDKYTAIWDDLSPDINKSLSTMRESAEENLKKFASILTP